MTTLGLFTSHWNFNLTTIIIGLVMLVFHYVTNGYRFKRKSRIYLSGVFLYLLVSFSPLEFLGHLYLFSAHMIVHIMLLLIIPPMLVAGTDTEFLQRLVSKPWMQKIGIVLFNPVVTWILGVGSMWLWHIPALFDAMKQSPFLMTTHVVSLLIMGLIFIWPVFTPVSWHKLQPLQCALYLFTACVGCTVLGILITFLPAGVFTAQLMGHDPAVLNLVQKQWGITPEIDQQMGGLIMWIPACFVYLTNIMIMLGKWYKNADAEEIRLNIKTHEQHMI